MLYFKLLSRIMQKNLRLIFLQEQPKRKLYNIPEYDYLNLNSVLFVWNFSSN